MNNVLTCLIVEDEPAAQQILLRFISQLPYLQVAGVHANPIVAMEALRSASVDILFLDLDMPAMNGIDMLKLLSSNSPLVVITTAHAPYAVDSYNYNVADYLLKPISLERFIRAINKVRDRLAIGGQSRPNSNATPSMPASQEVSEAYFFVKDNKKLTRVELADIQYVEGMKDYIKLHMKDRRLIIHMTIKRLEEQLPPADFIRINRSYIVRIGAIREIEGNMLEVESKQWLPIGVTYKETVFARLAGKLF